MGLIAETVSPQLSGALPAPAPVAAPSLAETVSAAFNQENDMANLWELSKLKEFPADPNFDRQAELDKRGLWEQRDLFVGTKSLQAFDRLLIGSPVLLLPAVIGRRTDFELFAGGFHAAASGQ